MCDYDEASPEELEDLGKLMVTKRQGFFVQVIPTSKVSGTCTA